MVRCNRCGKNIENAKAEKVDFLKVKKSWGYFSEKDGETHSFSICEKCYDAICKEFVVPVEITETTEML